MIPIAELRAWTGATASTETDALLTRLEAYAVEQVALTTGAYLGVSGNVTDRVIGDGSTLLRLPKAPATAVATVSESWLTDTDPDPVSITAFTLRAPVLYRTGGGVWQRGAEYAIAYTAGYAADAFPELYRQAVLDIVKAQYDAETASLAAEGDLSQETLGEYSYKVASSANADADSAAATVKAILAQLPRRVRV